ncbi:MAG: ATP phosphoribosyltransferase regulatory subunit [Actinomycetota bacterium]|nr:ATP phosphoribosyltransferase regulatory subunit [Actinomycetota bacterium]
MAELGAIIEPMRAQLESAGYGQLYTPALEFEDVMDRGDVESTEPAFKLFDERGRTLVLRSDMTIPTARVVATRYPADDYLGFI